MKTQFEIDSETTMNVNNKPMSLGTYNLIVSKRDMTLFCVGIKPHRFWKFNDVKKYFGLKGDKFSIKKQLDAMVESRLNKVS